MTDDNYQYPEEHLNINLASTPIVSDAMVAVGHIEQQFDCDCGQDHSKEKMVIFHINTNFGVLQFLAFESSDFFKKFMKDEFSEQARDCLVQLETRELD